MLQFIYQKLIEKSKEKFNAFRNKWPAGLLLLLQVRLHVRTEEYTAVCIQHHLDPQETFLCLDECCMSYIKGICTAFQNQ